MSSDLNIMVQDNALVREIISLAEKVIKVALKLKKVTAEHIAIWKKAFTETSPNGPPALGVNAGDGVNTKDVFGR